MSRPFSAGGVNYVGVEDLAASVSWYKEKLGLHEINAALDDCEGCVALGFSNEGCI